MNARISYVVFPIALILALTCPLHAQDAAGDQAKVLLKQGMDQYKALDFSAAKATLLKVDASALGEADKKTLEDSLTRVDPAIKQQTADREAMASAEKALKDSDLDKAKDGFATAAGSDYLTGPERKDARTQLAQVLEKLKKSVAATEPAKTVTTETTVADEPAASSPTAATVAATPATAPGAMETLEADRAETAKKLIAQGKSEMDNNQPDKAVVTLGRAKALAPDDKEIPELLAQAQKLVGGGQDILNKYEQQRAILRDIALMEFGKDMQRSREALTGADSTARFDTAAQAAEAARAQIISNKNIFSSTQEYEDKLRQAEDQIKYVATQRDVFNRKQANVAAAEAERANQQRVARIMEQKRATIATLKARAKALQAEQKYDEALDVLEQILQLDPNDEYAAGSKDTLMVMRSLHGEKAAYDDLREQWTKQSIHTREAEIPWIQELQYPKNWRDITVKRKDYAIKNDSDELEADRAVRVKLRTRIAKLSFDPIADDFGHAIDSFQTLSGVNFHANWRVLDAAGVTSKTPVNLNLTDVTVAKALEVLLSDLGSTKLGYMIDEGVVTISTKDDLAKDSISITRSYDVSDLLFVVPDFTGPVMTLQVAGNSSSSGSGSNNPWSNNTTNNTSNNNNNATRQQMMDLIIATIKNTVDKDSWVQPDLFTIQPLHEQLVVTQTAENHKSISKLLEMLRESKSLQISIEARFVQVNSGFFNSIGVNVNTYFNLGSQLGGGGTTIDPFTGAVVPVKGPSGWGTSPPGSNNLTPIGVIQGVAPTTPGGAYTPGYGSQESLYAVAPPNSVAEQVGATPNLQMAGTFLDDIQVDFILQATQANSTTRTLTAPRLTLYNGQQAFVSVGEQRNYIASLTQTAVENTVATTAVIGNIIDGTTLQVQATAADRRYVTLTVTPTVTKIISIDTFVISNAVGALQLPRVGIQQVSTTVSVPDGGTLLLGGQMTTSETEQEGGVPILSKIPFIDRFFTNRGKMRDESTLLILIKPKIIIQKEQEEDFFPSTK